MLINDVRRVTVSFGAAIAAMALWSGFAFADAMAESGPARESNGLRMRTFKVADVVVQQPPAAQPTVVAPAPVVADTGPRKVVQADTHSRNYVGTIMWSALGGAVLGAAVGTAIYFLSEDDDPPRAQHRVLGRGRRPGRGWGRRSSGHGRGGAHEQRHVHASTQGSCAHLAAGALPSPLLGDGRRGRAVATSARRT